MATKRIEVLRDILLRLHNGESAESVQAEFDEHFSGVSAIEISLMEHELMNSNSGVTFEDVMKLCNVHANLFKGAIKNVEVEDSEHPGHPVQVFKQENIKPKVPVLKAILQALSEKDESADICYDNKGNKEADTDLRDTEQIPVKEEIEAYFEREVLPYAPDAWIDESKTKKGYEIPFTRHFYKYTELGNADDTLKEIEILHEKIQHTIKELFSEV